MVSNVTEKKLQIQYLGFFRITIAKIKTFSRLFQHPCPILGLFRTSGNPVNNKLIYSTLIVTSKRLGGYCTAFLQFV